MARPLPRIFIQTLFAALLLGASLARAQDVGCSGDSTGKEAAFGISVHSEQGFFNTSTCTLTVTVPANRHMAFLSW
jgi:hypothetical protein